MFDVRKTSKGCNSNEKAYPGKEQKPRSKSIKLNLKAPLDQDFIEMVDLSYKTNPDSQHRGPPHTQNTKAIKTILKTSSANRNEWYQNRKYPSRINI